MIDTIKHYISVTAFNVKLSLQSQLEYPYFLVCWLIGIPIQYLTGIWMIQVVIQRFHELNGWNFPQLAFLYGISLLSHGLMVVLFIPTWGIEYMVIRGEFDRLKIRPMNVFFQCMVRRINLIGCIDMIPGSIIFFYGCSLVHFNWTIINSIKILLILTGAVLIRAAYFTIACSVAFWTKKSRFLVGISETIFERTTMYPLSIYPSIFQIIFTFILPFGFISFYPASDFFGKQTGFSLPMGFAVWTPVIGALMVVLASLVFGSGLKRYESSGS